MLSSSTCSHLLVVALCVCAPLATSGAKILLIPLTHWSHVNLFASHGSALVAKGHHVSMVTVDVLGDRLKGTGIKQFLFPSPEYEEMEAAVEEMSPKLVTGEVTFAHLIHTVLEIKLEEIVRNILQNTELLQSLEAEQFDLAIVDGFIPFRFIYSLPYRLSVPHVTLSAVVDPWAAGVTAMPSVEPVQFLPMSHHMSFTERATNTFITIIFKIRGFLLFNINKMDNFVEKYIPDKPLVSTDELHQRSLFWFINIETHCVDYPRLEGPNYKFIGGSSARDPRPLPQDIADFMDGAEHGVVAMSFGSAKGFSSVITYLKDILLEAFGNLKQRVIFQCDPAKFESLPPNVKCVDWLPQNDVLGHPNTVLFITHGGNNGQLESIYHGVPVLTIPITTEQHYNGNRAAHHQYGLLLNPQTLTSRDLLHSINEITSSPKFKDNVQKCSAILRQFPSPQETLVFWVEHILRFGGDHLRPASADMPMWKLYNLDIYALLIFIVFNIIHLFIHLVIYIVKKCRKSKQKLE